MCSGWNILSERKRGCGRVELLVGGGAFEWRGSNFFFFRAGTIGPKILAEEAAVVVVVGI